MEHKNRTCDAINSGRRRYHTMNKRTSTLLLWMAMTAASFGQAEWVMDASLWLPQRKTNHLRSLRTYIPSDSIMGARRLESTAYYDRHGYQTSDSIRLGYDDEGRLTERLVLAPSHGTPSQGYDTIVRQRIYYSPEGLVAYFAEESFQHWGHTSYSDTVTEIYQLISHKYSTSHGITECRYRRTYSDPDKGLLIIDSCGHLREFDSLGRMIRQRRWQMNEDFHDEKISYGSDGRKQFTIFQSGYWHDSTAYQYNQRGELISSSGELSEGQTVMAHFASYRPNGTPILETTIEYSYDPELEDYDRTLGITTRCYYDSHGTLIRYENPLQPHPVVEYDPEYWPE